MEAAKNVALRVGVPRDWACVRIVVLSSSRSVRSGDGENVRVQRLSDAVSEMGNAQRKRDGTGRGGDSSMCKEMGGVAQAWAWNDWNRCGAPFPIVYGHTSIGLQSGD
jgi:hypothetical protein